MVNVFSGTGGSASHRGRPAAPHRAVLTAYRSSGRPSNPPIPRKYRPKTKPQPKPIRLPPPLGPSPNPFKFGRVMIPHPPPGPVSPYVNPFAGSTQLSPARIDMGVDYFGRGKIGAIGPGVITASGTAWQGAVGAPSPGTWITEKITAGPLKGQQVYVAEDVAPLVKTGQTVKAGQPIGQFVQGSGGVQYAIETGIAAPGAAGAGGQTMADYAGQAAGGRDPGAVPTAWGIAYARVLRALKVPTVSIPQSGTGTAPSFGTGGRVSLPPALPPATIPSGVNPPASGGVAMPAVTLAAVRMPARQRKAAARKASVVPLPIPPATTPAGGTPVTTTTSTGTVTSSTAPPTFISSSPGTGGITPVAAPATSSGGGSTLLLVAGAGVVLLVILFSRKKGK